MSTIANGFTTSQIAACISPRRLELTILPTEKCNFRCTYCYEDFKIGRMKRPVVEGICNLVKRRGESGLEYLSLSWFGGEPLLAMNVVAEISSYALSLSQQHGFGFGGGITTNGYHLTPEVLSRLVSLRQFDFQITLDGWGQGHDETRRRADGAGTFQVIWANLLAAKKTSLDFNIALRIHVTDKNQDSLRELAENVWRELAGDSRFDLNFQDVRNLGGDGGKRVVAVSAGNFKSRVRELKAIAKYGLEDLSTSKGGGFPVPEVIADTGDEPLRKYESSGSRSGYMEDDNYICYAAKPNHFLIRSNGRVGKCTVALSDSRNDIGFIAPDGSIIIDQELARMWSNGLETLDADKLGCPIAHWTKSVAGDSIPLRLVQGG